jgi:myo-inositol-1(or 4)-monophosphatase
MLNIAIKAARAAGAVINRGSQDLDLLTVSTKGPNDFVSEVDRAAEAAIIETLLGAYPGHAILAEESGRTHGARHSDYTWIIDPLDGTTNFLHGFPVYCVSIALAFRGKVEQAVVYDPNRNDLFYASRGRGAYLNDRRLRVSRRIRLAEALVGTGFPFRRGDNFQRYLQMFETVMQQCAGLRRPGAAALDLCYVAAGWYDGFFETGLNPWDMAAGSLMITEAGGLIGNFTGEADFLYQREVVAGNPKVYGQLVTLLAPYTKAIKGEDGQAAETAAAAAPSPSDTVAAALAATLPDTPPATLPATLPARAPMVAKSANKSAVKSAPKPDHATLAATPADATAAPARERKPVRIRRPETPPTPTPTQAAAERPPRKPRPDEDRPRTARPPTDRPRGPKPFEPGRGPGHAGPRPPAKGRGGPGPGRR